MKTILKSVLSIIISFSLVIFISCAAKTTNAPMGSNKGFSTKTGSNVYYKVVLKNMDRRECKSRMRVVGDTRLYDAVYFDVEVHNILPETVVVAYDAVFTLVTDEGNHIDCCAVGWKGAFDGDIGEIKSRILEPGEKKTGAIGFPLKKTSKPTKLIFDPSLLDIPAETIIFELQ
jgi:hypothetical protein